MVERQFNKQVKNIRTDNEIEFAYMENYFLENEIIFQTSCMGHHNKMGGLNVNINIY